MTTAQMNAARLYRVGEPLVIESIPVPTPGPDEVLVEVAACGLCGTDIHLAVDGDIPVSRSPITLGHEAAGSVAVIGAAVSDYQVGDRVALFPSATCGRCRFCLAGRESLCEGSQVYGMSRDGALARSVVAPARTLVQIPDEVPFAIAAVVTDSVATPFHALRSRGALKAGETVAVVGCGGLGTHAIILARMMGAGYIVAIDVHADARVRALKMGADLAIDPLTDPKVRQVIKQHIGHGVDLALEFVGRADTVATALGTLDTAGRCVVVGVGAEKPVLPPLLGFVGREHSVIGSFGMDKRDIADLLTLIARGRLNLDQSVSACYSLAEINDALSRLATKETGLVRLVIEPGS